MGKETEAKTVVNVARPAPEPSWPPVRVVLRVIFITLAVASALWILSKLTTVILLLILSIFFAYLVSPLVEILHRPRRFGGRQIALPRVLAIGVAYLLIFASILAVIYFVVPQLASQFPLFAEQAQSYSKAFSLKTQQLNEYFKQHSMPKAIVNGIDNVVPIVLEKISAGATVLLTSVAGWVVFVPWIILIPILSFFLLKDADGFRRSALQMLPRGRWRWRGDEFFQDVNSTLAAYTRAQLTACMFIGSVCAGGFAIVGLPSPLVLGLIAGLLEFVPLIGPLSMAVLAALVALFHTGFSAAVMVLIFLAVLRILQDYIIYPRLIGHGIHLHPLAIIIAILSGAELAGVTGIFLAIPIVAIVTVSYRHWMEHRGSEGLADLLEDDLNAVAADLSELIPKTIHETKETATADTPSTHPTSTTTAAEMTRARPDLTTGELKLPVGE